MDPRLTWFEKIYDTYADAIFRHLYMRLGDRERAKELTQEVFMKVWQYRMMDKTILHEKAFLYRVAHNLFVNEIRTKRENISLDSMVSGGAEPADMGERTDSVALQSELLDRMSSLSDSHRTILILRYIDELGVKEIAELLSEKETTISMRINRALEALRTLYESPLTNHGNT